MRKTLNPIYLLISFIEGSYKYFYGILAEPRDATRGTTTTAGNASGLR